MPVMFSTLNTSLTLLLNINLQIKECQNYSACCVVELGLSVAVGEVHPRCWFGWKNAR